MSSGHEESPRAGWGRGGAGAMATYNMGDFGVSRDQIRVMSALPDINSAQQILIGGSFQ